jgi:hypothetical protein
MMSVLLSVKWGHTFFTPLLSTFPQIILDLVRNKTAFEVTFFDPKSRRF